MYHFFFWKLYMKLSWLACMSQNTQQFRHMVTWHSFTFLFITEDEASPAESHGYKPIEPMNVTITIWHLSHPQLKLGFWRSTATEEFYEVRGARPMTWVMRSYLVRGLGRCAAAKDLPDALLDIVTIGFSHCSSGELRAPKAEARKETILEITE
jgi:hypothetical protein